MKVQTHLLPRTIAAAGVVAAALLTAPVRAQQTMTSRMLAAESDRVRSVTAHHYNSPAERARDDRIIVEVKSEIAKDELLDGYLIDIDSDHGTVFLNGVVKSADDARLAERDADRVPGVVEVRNRLTWQ